MDELVGCLIGIPSNTTGSGQSGEDSFCHSYWKLPLQGNAVWFEECRVYLSEDDDQDVRTTIRQKC